MNLKETEIYEGYCLRQQYDILKVIDRGSFGTVLQIRNKKTNMCYAAKIITFTGEFDTEAALRQVKLLSQIQSDHVVQLINQPIIDENNKQIAVVMELCKGNIKSFKQQWTYENIIHLMIEVTSAFFYLNKKKIAHRDLKPQNILFTQQGCFKICDFGNSIAISGSKISINQINFGTPAYVSPEMLISSIQHLSLYHHDIWSFGIILYQLVYGQHPFQQDPNNRQISPILLQKFYKAHIDIRYPMCTEPMNKIVNIIKKMLTNKNQQRINWQEMQIQLLKLSHYKQNCTYQIQSVEFLDISTVFLNHKLVCLIFSHVVVAIRQNIAASFCQFWLNAKTKILLLCLVDLIIQCLSYFQNKFNSLFRHKFAFLSCQCIFQNRKMMKMINQQLKNKSMIKITENTSNTIQTLLFKKCKEILSLRQEQNKKYKSVGKLFQFCQEIVAAQNLSLFCNSKPLQKTRKNFEIDLV